MGQASSSIENNEGEGLRWNPSVLDAPPQAVDSGSSEATDIPAFPPIEAATTTGAPTIQCCTKEDTSTIAPHFEKLNLYPQSSPTGVESNPNSTPNEGCQGLNNSEPDQEAGGGWSRDELAKEALSQQEEDKNQSIMGKGTTDPSGRPNNQASATSPTGGPTASSAQAGTDNPNVKKKRPSSIVNPYAKKKRRQAPSSQQPPTTLAHVVSQEEEESDQTSAASTPPPVLPKGLSSFDKFFTILLRHNPPQSYLKATKSLQAVNLLWKKMCRVAKLPTPSEHLKARYGSPKEHFEVRAALVLEEVRETICKEVKLRWEIDSRGCLQPKKTDTESDNNDSVVTRSWVSVECTGIEWDKETEITKAVFQKEKGSDGKRPSFSAQEQRGLMYTTLLECVARFSNLQWGVIKYASAKECVAHFYQSAPIPKGFWEIRPLGGMLITGFRQFFACTSGQTREVEFLDAIIGAGTTAASDGGDKAPVRELKWVGPQLNPKQEMVVSEFLSCPTGTLQVVQGPPGCGKTFLLVSLIRNYLENRTESRKKLMVCAPTNKAVSVLAHRVIESICPNGEEPEVGITVLGDFMKLSDGLGNKSSLRPFHEKEFLKVIICEIGKVVGFCRSDSNATSAYLCRILRKIQSRLKLRLRNLPADFSQLVESLCLVMEGYHASVPGSTLEKVADTAHSLMKRLKELGQGDMSSKVTKDLLDSTDLFFCTLYTAGGTSLSNTQIDDLVVDEAAAATEPSIYIPLQLNPRRMQIVGDPKQLPAVVNSKLARELGLDESLHERLMARCQYSYILLNEQYRMHPEISAFPSQRFYGNKISDGKPVLCSAYGSGANVVFRGKPLVFCNIRGTLQHKGSAILNPEEANAVVEIVRLLSKSGGSEWDSSRCLRIITFYHGQRALIGKLLKKNGFANVEVSTVDSSQGCEADVVLVSFVRGGTSHAGFMKDDRRLNVALTRAKHQLICIGNVYGLQEVAETDARTLRLLSEDAQDRGIVRSRIS